MSLFSGDIQNLSNLLNESKESQKHVENYNQKPAKGGSVVVKSNSKVNEISIGEDKTISKAIWSLDEIPSEESLRSLRDERPCPKYEISYKQSVGTEDTFLGLGEITPLSSDCTHLIVKAHFPGSKLKDLDLDVTKNTIRISSKDYLLFTYLPVDIDEANGKAKFDSKKEVITVTLPILAEF